jgi:hypothetical protein
MTQAKSPLAVVRDALFALFGYPPTLGGVVSRRLGG